MINDIIKIIQEAGIELIKIYLGNDFDIVYKQDNSPLTRADSISNDIIIKGLKKISHFPIITEESPISYTLRKNWKKFWLVDPLDGTKDFIAKNGEFTLNIALIEDNAPILGVVLVPFTKDLYYATKGGGAYKNGKKIYNFSKRDKLIASDSNFHSSQMTKDFFMKHDIKQVQRYGSSLKICKLAEGVIDIYPRLNGTKEWDTAASHIIANESGCKLIDIETNQELLYNKINIQNNFFIASRNNLELTI